ncbi:unnamed protein product [Phytophthora fragariaefolia]|uniref:Unnamed protein product n=1 Tax=Phytophthora fragariaefolia TaxID=1490495 RepID=A0A9W6UC76_9STRA|nr:unnamed protein product [Phytophthora fragariaefolia]
MSSRHDRHYRHGRHIAMVATTDTIDWIDTKGRVDANHDPLDDNIEHDQHEGTIDTIKTKDMVHSGNDTPRTR